MTSKSQSEETKTTKEPFAECTDQMMSACGPEMKKWMEACTSNTCEGATGCCGMQTKTETAEK